MVNEEQDNNSIMTINCKIKQTICWWTVNCYINIVQLIGLLNWVILGILLLLFENEAENK